MRRSRFSQTQLVGILNQGNTCPKVLEAYPKHGIKPDLL